MVATIEKEEVIDGIKFIYVDGKKYRVLGEIIMGEDDNNGQEKEK